MSALPDTISCRKCGGEGHLFCRPNAQPGNGENYTVDCEDCNNSTFTAHADAIKAIEQWNSDNTPSGLAPGSAPCSVVITGKVTSKKP